MATLRYEIVEHDGGWAYRADGTYSETYPNREAAAKAAHKAAGGQAVAGRTTGIVYEDEQGHWHGEIADGADRPQTEVED